MQLSNDQLLLPGFIDLHIHAPQWPNAGVALDLPLEDWLNVYTFPLESKFQSSDFAKKVYEDLVQELLAQGTTTALYFGSVHNAGNLELVKACLKYQQRGFVGKVVMDNPQQTPANYRDESAAQALTDTKTFINSVYELNKKARIAVTPVITPRFLPSCTSEALAGLGRLARQYNLPIQSHCSESDWENGYALQQYHQRDAAVLDHFGLLTDKAVMAHGTLLNEADLDLFHRQEVSLAHCPISNVYFGNAILPAKQILERNNKIGLGTDISGGFSPSIYQNIRQAIISSHQRYEGVDAQLDPQTRGTKAPMLTMQNAFYMATIGGALSLHVPTGQIKAGCYADLQIVHQNWKTFQTETPQLRFEKLLYQTDKANIDQVLVQGKIVIGKEKYCENHK
ncbi:amidohydrolase family protein [Bombilactobacillus bombi]|uniref:amidohydrolase family protein n=1 Tax=Bombilactobacillus bombi TaxID=1303590 RepID=UPI001C636E37|nr:amidohydrolase family protein [Bombilactobacillus bombi]